MVKTLSRRGTRGRVPCAALLLAAAARACASDAIFATGFETEVTTYVPYVAMPPNETAKMRWITSETAVVRDRVGGDLVGFFRGDTQLHAAVSRNDGDSWSWVNAAASVTVAMPNTIAQSSDGTIHVLSELQGSGALGYSRLSLARDANGHITGFTAEVTNLALALPTGFGELRVQLVPGLDAAGNPTLFYAMYDWVGSGANWARIQAGRTSVAAGLAPTTPADFVSLSNTAGATVIAQFGGSDPFGSPHNNGVQMAQHPGSRDLWFQWGPLDTGDTITSNTYPVMRRRAVVSGATTWTLDNPVTVDGFAAGYASEAGPLTTSSDRVWFTRMSSSGGVVIDSADASGTITPNALPSPYPTPKLGGWTCFAVNAAGTRAWAGGWIVYDSAVDGTTRWSAQWNGGAWTRQPNDASLADSNGLGCSSGWDQGLVIMMLDVSPVFPYSGSPSFATLRTE